VRGWWIVGWLSACALVACGGGQVAAGSAFGSGDTLAALAVIDTRTDHRPVTATVYDEASDGQALVPGDAVRTDERGFAEVVYADGSLTRLGPGTEFSLVALGGDTTVPEIEVELEVGETWHRVKTVTGERGRFEVQTAVGTAAVRGTAFAIACTDEPVCTFTVTEGIVVVTTLDGREIEVVAGDALTIGLAQDPDGGDGSDGSGAGGDETGDGVATGDGGSGADGASDGVSDGTTDASSGDGDGGTGAGGASDGVSDGTTDAGSGDGDGGDTGTAGGVAQGGARTVVLAHGAIDEVDETGGAGVRALGTWVARNQPLDVATGRFSEQREACSVTVNGRNVEHADSPETAIEAPIDELLRIDAVATGVLETYQVDLRFAGVNVRAAQGRVLADESGDRTTFRGDVAVARYAQWGVGLYEVIATTTGTRCDAGAFVNVTGRNPLTTGTGIAALLLALGGAAGLVAAINLATGRETATFIDPPTTMTTTTQTTSMLPGTTFTADGGTQRLEEPPPEGQHDPGSWLTRIADWFRSGGSTGEGEG